MTIRTGICGLLLALMAEGPGGAQTLNNQSLNGKYFFRHLSLGTDGTNATSLTDTRSLIGTITFDSNGRYSFIGQQVIGSTAAAAASGSGAYAVDAGGFV